MTKPPPFTLYPLKYDSDETLFLVYNTSESVLAKENPAWSDEIEIIPQGENEIWADSGFANISGELFYYNSVDKKEFNGQQRVFKFKECVRNLGGETSKHNNPGEMVRGFVIAEHHNQIVDAVINIQNFIGENYSEDTETLDYRIRNLDSVPVIFDDFNCPEINFTFNIVDDNPTTGVLASYNIDINGSFTNFKLDFGDGNYTSNILQGTHTYSPNSTPDPVLTIYNDSCSTTITPTNRTASIEPVVAEFNPPLEIPIPPPPEIPPILITPFIELENKYNIPPIVFPCLDVGSLGNVGNINIPSGIYVNIPSTVNISPISIPSTITISPISIPSEINVVVPSDITLQLSSINISPITIDTGGHDIIIPSLIQFGPVPTLQINTDGLNNVLLGFDLDQLNNAPPIPINWYTAGEDGQSLPNLVCTVMVQCPTSSVPSFMGPISAQNFEEPSMSTMIEVESLGIPSVINIVPPNIPPIKIDSSDVPSSIKIEQIQNIPEEIRIVSPNLFIPSEIRLVSEGIIPSSIKLDSSGVPSVIKLESNIPEFIGLKIPDNFPTEIKLNASEIPDQIQVVGIPPVIELKGEIPSTIQLVMPEKPEIEMVYKGAPIDVKIQLDISKVAGDGQNLNCVAIVPCK